MKSKKQELEDQLTLMTFLPRLSIKRGLKLKFKNPPTASCPIYPQNPKLPERKKRPSEKTPIKSLTLNLHFIHVEPKEGTTKFIQPEKPSSTFRKKGKGIPQEFKSWPTSILLLLYKHSTKNTLWNPTLLNPFTKLGYISILCLHGKI